MSQKYIYVSCFYNLYNNDNDIQDRLKNIKVLLDWDLPIIVFLDPSLKEKFLTLNPSEKIIIIEKSLDQFNIFNSINNRDNLELPLNSNGKKDIKSYFGLMNNKIEFIRESVSLGYNYQYYCWIDLGISKIFKNFDEVKNRLKNLYIPEDEERIIMPHINEKIYNQGMLYNNPCWRFAGGFFICPQDKVEEFYNLSLRYLQKYLDENKIVWEVNIWCNIELDNPDYFYTYKSDHDDSIIIKEFQAEEIIKNVIQFRMEQNWEKAYKYYLLTKKIELPEHLKDLLLYESTIILYYVNQREEGFKNMIITMNKLNHYYPSCFENLVHYLPCLSNDCIDYHEYKFSDLGEIAKNGDLIPNYYFASSPTLLQTNDGKILMNVRYVSYKLDPIANYWTPEMKGTDVLIKTKNLYYYLDENFRPVEGPVQFTNPDDLTTIDDTYIYGLEDVRLFYHQNKLKYLATSREYTTTNQIVYGEYSLEGKYQNNVILRANEYRCEKNWIPWVIKDKLYIIYSWYPLTIGILKENNLEIIFKREMPGIFHMFRGSTGLIEYEGLYWCVAHFVKETRPRKYHHSIVVFDKDFNLVKYSLPFYFNRYSVEYCLGFLIKENEYVFTFSQFDRESSLLRVKKDKITFLELEEELKVLQDDREKVYRPNIAVYYTGEVRTLRKTIDKMKERFFDINNCEVFACLQQNTEEEKEEIDKLLKNKLGDKLQNLIWVEKEDKEYIKLRDTALSKLEGRINYGLINYLKEGGSIIEYYHLWKCYNSMIERELKEEFKFDYIIRVRTDTMFFDPITLDYLYNISVNEVENKVESFKEYWNQKECIITAIMNSLIHPKQEENIKGELGIVYNVKDKREKQLLNRENYLIREMLNKDIDKEEFISLMKNYIRQGSYILTWRKNNIYFVKRDKFDLIPFLIFTYGNYGDMRDYEGYFWNAESQFREISFKAGLSVFDYYNPKGEEESHNYDPTREEKSDKILYAMVRS